MPIIPRHDRLTIYKLASFRSPHQIAMHRRPQLLPQLGPLPTRIPPRRVHIDSIHVRKAIVFVAGLAIVRRLDESFQAQLVCFLGAPAQEHAGRAPPSMFRMDEQKRYNWMEMVSISPWASRTRVSQR